VDRRLLLCAYFLVTTGCGVADRVRVDVPVADAVQVTDLRPAGSEASHTAAEPGGLRQHFGDADLHPPPPVMLAGALAALGTAGFTGRNVVLDEFSIDVFAPAVRLPGSGDVATATTTAGGVGAVVGYGVVAGIENSRSRKTITVRIAGSVDGLPFAATVARDLRGRITSRRIARVIGDALDGAAAAAGALAASGS
jgi:hypothetical protein